VGDGSNVTYGAENEQTPKLWLMSVSRHLWSYQGCTLKSID
jgi:hypothetical protein